MRLMMEPMTIRRLAFALDGMSAEEIELCEAGG